MPERSWYRVRNQTKMLRNHRLNPLVAKDTQETGILIIKFIFNKKLQIFTDRQYGLDGRNDHIQGHIFWLIQTPNLDVSVTPC